MNDFDSLTEYAKPKKIRKAKSHRQPVYFDDDLYDYKPPKAAGKRKHSRHIEIEYEDEEIDQYKAFIK